MMALVDIVTDGRVEEVNMAPWTIEDGDIAPYSII